MFDTPFIDDRHREIAATTAQFTRATVRAIACGQDEDSAAKALVRALADERLLLHVVPRPEDGKARVDVRSICVVRENLSYESSLADLMFAMQGLGSYPITLAASEATRARFLPRVAAGDAIAAFAVTEPDAGSDVAAIKTTATAKADQYVLNGMKTFISNAGLADFYTVFAKTDPAAGSKGLTAFVVEKDAPGFEFVEKIEMIAPHPIGRIAFRDCAIPKANRLGEEGQGFRIAMATLDTFRPTVGAAAVGLAWRALDEAVAYSKRRVQFGRTLAEYQATQLRLADMATELDAARLLVYRAAWKKDRGAERITSEAAMAKLFATESAQRIVDSAVQIHGGAGVVRGSVVEHLYRDVRALRIYEGTSEIQKLIIASQLLKD